MRVLARLSIPPTIKFETMNKYAQYFEVPDNPEGAALLKWFEKAAAPDRDRLMLQAHRSGMDLVTAHKHIYGDR